MNCLNINLPDIRKNLNDLTNIVGDKEVAYAILASNNGYNMEQTNTGIVSKLYNELEKVAGDKDKATVLKMRVHSPEFIEKFGAGLNQGIIDQNGEPKLFSRENLYYYIGKNSIKIPVAEIPIVKPKFKSKQALTIDSMSDEEINDTLVKQYTPNPNGPIEEGSFVKYQKPGSEGTTNMMVYKINKNDTINAFNLNTVTEEHLGKVTGISTQRFQKQGDFNVITTFNPKGPDKRSIVLSKSKIRKKITIINVTDKVSVNKEADNIQKKYINQAVNTVKLIEQDQGIETGPISIGEFTEKDNVFVHAESDKELKILIEEMDQDITAGVKTFFVVPTKLANAQDIEIAEYLNGLGWKYKTKKGVTYFTKPKSVIPAGPVLRTKEAVTPARKSIFDPLLTTNETVTDSQGKSHQIGSVAANAVRFMQDKGQNAVPFLKQDTTTTIGKALQTAIPEAYTFENNDIVEIAEANQYLKENLATSLTDPRIRALTSTDDINIYNQFVYDVYQEALHRAIMRNMGSIDKIIAFNLKVSHVQADLEKSIKNLETRKLNLQNEGASNEEISAIEQTIAEKQDILNYTEDEYTVETVKNIAAADLKRVERIIAKKNISSDDFKRGQVIIETWRKAGDFSEIANNIFLDESVAGEPAVQEDFRQIAKKAEALKDKLDIKGKNLLVNKISTTLNKIFQFDDLIKLKNKVNIWFKNMYSIAKVDNPVVAYIMKTINDANKKAEIQAITESNRLGELYQKLEKNNFDFGLFWQKDKDGTTTGNLLSEYTSEYLRNLWLFQNGYHTKNANMEKYKKDSIFIDMEVLAGASDLTKEKYINDISPFIGYDKAVSAVAEAERLFKQYEEVKANFIMAEFGKTEAELVKGTEEYTTFIKWKLLNSPAARTRSIKQASNDATYEGLEASIGARFVVVVPKKFDKYGEKTNLYDENFDSVMENEDAAAFYKSAFKITKKAKEHFNTSSMSEYSLGSIQNTVMEEYTQRGVKEFTQKTLWDKAIDYAVGKEQKKEVKDPVTDEVIKVLDKGVLTIDELIRREVTKIHENRKYTKQMVRKLSDEEHIEIFKLASDTVMKSSSGDIFKALNALNFAALSYGFKSAIKPDIEMAMHYLDQMDAGVSDETMYFNDIGDADIKNTKEMVDYFIDKTYFDIANEDNSYRLPLRLYTSAERKRRKELLTQQIAFEKDPKAMAGVTTPAKIKTELNSIGRDITVNSILKGLMDFLRISTMGWNVQAAIANLMQGQIVNIVHAAEGKLYTFEALKKAYYALFNEKTKFDNVIKNYALLGDIMYNFERKTPFEKKRGLFGRLKRLANPFEGTRITEKLNQGNIMIAMMMHTKVKGPKGEVSMWDAIDKNGTLSDEYEYRSKIGNEAVSEMVIKLREQINIIQGDYTNAKMLQKTIAGRAASMFKLWFFDPFQARFGSKKYNYILEKETRGRYLSAMDLIKKYGINYKKIMQDKKDGKINETDLDNMRVNLMELAAIALTGMAALLAKSLLCNDKETKCGSVGSTYLVNSLSRINSEVSTFMNPMQYYDFISNPVAVVKYLKSIATMFDYMAAAAAGEDMDNKDGHNKMILAAGKELPFLRRLILGRDLMDNVRKY